MGFLDNVKKGLDDAAKGLNQAVGNQPTSPPPAQTFPAVNDDEFIDGLHPETWLQWWDDGPESLLADGLPITLDFSELQVFETDEAFVARYVDATNGFTLDLASVKEDTLGTFGTQETVISHYAAPLTGVTDLDIGDASMVGSSGPGHVEIVACMGDLVSKCDLYGPAWLDVDRAGNNLRELVLVALRLYS